MKKVISLLLSVIFLITALQPSVFASTGLKTLGSVLQLENIIEPIQINDYEPSWNELLNQEVANTTPIDAEAPTVPLNLEAMDVTETSATLSWDASTDNVGVESYQIFEAGELVETSTETTCNIIDLIQGESYTYIVKAYDEAGNASLPSQPVLVTTIEETEESTVIIPAETLENDEEELPLTLLEAIQELDTPQNFQLEIVTTTTALISWEPVVNATLYGVVVNGTVITEVEGNTYEISNLMPMTSYSVSIYSKCGEIQSENTENIYFTTNESTTINGSITEDTVFSMKNSPYILESKLIIPENTVLLIEPGVRIFGTENAAIDVFGELRAIGTQEKPVVITGMYDTGYDGGYDNGYGTNWVGIKVEGSGVFEGDYVKVRYGGAYSSNGMSLTDQNNIYVVGSIQLTNSEIYNSGIAIDTVDEENVLINNNDIQGYYSAGISLKNFVTGEFEVQNNIIHGISGYVGIEVYLDGQMTDTLAGIAGNSFEDSYYAGTLLRGNSQVDITLPEGNYYLESKLIIPAGKLMKLEPGAKIFGSQNAAIDAFGKLQAIGTQEKPVVITGMYDTGYDGGYDNGYGTNWVGIKVEGSGVFEGDYVKVRYGGAYSSNGTSLTDQNNIYVVGSIQLTNSEVYGSGITINSVDEENVLINSNDIQSNSNTGIYLQNFLSGEFEIKNNVIHGMVGYAGIEVYLDGQQTDTMAGITGNSFEEYCNYGVLLRGTLQTDISLPEGDYYIDSKVIIPEGKLMKLEPGVKIFGSQNASIDAFGKLQAIGTEEKSIVLTAMYDTAYNGGENSNYVYPWIGIRVEVTGEFEGDYVKVRCAGWYEGASLTNCSNIYVLGSIYLTNSEVSDTTFNGITIDSTDQQNVQINNNIIKCMNSGIVVKNFTSGEFEIKGNNIYGNQEGGGGIVIILDGQGTNTTSGIKENSVEGYMITNGIGLVGTLRTDLILQEGNYYFESNVTIAEGSSMQMEPGVKLFGREISNLLVAGSLHAMGTEEKPIVMTSFYDTSYGGLNIGGMTPWGGIKVEATGEFDGKYVIVRYGGYGSYYLPSITNNSNIYVLGRLTLNNSEINNASYYGITFNSNQQSEVHYSSFQNQEGICNNSDTVVNATNNYWNSLSGPSVWRYIYDSSSYSWNWTWIGTGEKVSNNIDYFPYIGSELTTSLHLGQTKGTYAPTGNYSNHYTDLSVNCLEDVISFNRTYNSQSTDSNTLFGQGWTFNFESSITDYEYMNNIKIVKLPDGSQESYTVNANGTYTSNNSRNSLIKQSDGSYILTTKSQVKYGFNTTGVLAWIENKQGNRLIITVDSSSKIQSIIDFVGRQYTFTYANNLLKTITDPLGRVVTYDYTNNQLKKVTDSEGIETNYEYDAFGNLIEIRDENNNLIESIRYINSNDVPQVDQVTDINGNVKTYTYDRINGKTIITDSNGRTNTQWYDGTYDITNSTDAEGKTTSVAYFTDGGSNKFSEVESVTDRNGNKTTNVRDTKGNITKVTNPNGSYKLYTYDTKNNVTRVRDESGKFTYYVYDADKILLLKIAQPLNGTDVYSDTADQSKFAITSYTYYQLGENGYNIKGLVKSVTDPEGHPTIYTYDDYGNVQTAMDSESNTITYGYNIIGLNTSIQSPKGEVTTFTFDNNGNLELTVQDGGETTRIIYDDLGRKVQEITPNIYLEATEGGVGYRYTYYSNYQLYTMTDPENNTTTYTYDLYGNVQTEKKSNGSIYSSEYDVMNRISKVYFQDDLSSEKVLLKSYSYTVLSDFKLQKSETIYLNATETATTIYLYDYAERLVKQTNPDGTIISTSYNTNGTIYSTTDAKGKITYNKYDGLNRLTQQWIPCGSSRYTYIAFTYDKKGNVTAEKVGVNSVGLWGVATVFITKAYTYDCNNHVKTITDSSNGLSEYEYDVNGNMNKEIKYLDETHAKVTEYQYNHLGKVDTVMAHVEAKDIFGNDPEDTTDMLLITNNTYDANGNIKTTTTPDNITTSYEYDTMNRLTKESVASIDEYGNTVEQIVSTTYDFAGNILTGTDANGNLTQNIYTSRGLLEKTIDPEGGISAFYYDLAGRLITKVLPKNFLECAATSLMSRVVFTYDKMNRVILEQDVYFDEITGTFKTINSMAYQYDSNGNVIKSLDALGYASGTGSTIAAKISSGYGTIYTYDDANLLLTSLSPVTKDLALTYDIKYTYDAVGRKLTETNANNVIKKFYYDDAGRLLKATVMNSTEKVLQQNTYDFTGNLLTQSDANGNIITFAYNNLGLLRSKITTGGTTIDAYSTIYLYNQLGQMVFQKDNMGKVNYTSLNHYGQILTQTEEYEDASQSITISNRYDLNGNLRFASDANGLITEYEYNGVNKLMKTKATIAGVLHQTINDYDLNGNLLTESDWLGNTYTYSYDPLNRLIQKTDPYGKIIEKYEYNINHAQIKSYDALGRVTQYSYDKNNRLLVTTDPLNYTVSQTYDKVGNIATQKDANYNITTFGYDVLYNLIKVTNAKNEITSYTYDLNGNMLTQKDANLKTITFTYNQANQLISKVDPNGTNIAAKTESYTYYGNGLLKTRTDRNGQIFTCVYDIHGNLLTESVGEEITSYTYDAIGNMLTVTNETGTSIRTYDGLNRVITKMVPNIGTVTYEYDLTTGIDSGCSKERSTDPKGNVTEKVYDRVGRLFQVIVGSNITTYTYYDNGNRASVTYNDGSKEEYTYFANNQVKSLINKKVNGTVMDNYSYTYDNAGNQLTKQETINGVNKGRTTFTYDTLNRLLTVSEPNGRITTFTYDKVGNRSNETIVFSGATTINTYVYTDQNRLTSITTKVNNVTTKVTQYIYDNNGNQLTTTVKGYTNGVLTSTTIIVTNTYDKRNQLIGTATVDGTIVHNSYNGEGLRISKEVNDQRMYYLYEHDKVVLEVDASGGQVARNVYGTNLLMRTVEGETYYYLYNGHADVTALIKENGQVAATYYYDAFGNILERTGDVENDILYSGYQYDEETGLYYLNARMYDPKIARFLQEDTYGGEANDPLSLNRYTYCANNPIVYFDPTGHKKENSNQDDDSWFKKKLKKSIENYLTPLSLAKVSLGFGNSKDEVRVSNLISDNTYDALKVVEPYCEELTNDLGIVLSAPVNIVNNTSVDLANGDFSNIPSGIWGAITGERQTSTIDVMMSQKSQAKLNDSSPFLYQTLFAATTLIDPTIIFSGVKAFSMSTKVAGIEMLSTMDDDVVKLMANSNDDIVKMNYLDEPLAGDNIGVNLRLEGTVTTPGKFTGSLDGLKPFERTAINDIISQGKNVEIIPKAAGKTPDFFVNGVKTELKTLFPKDGVVNLNTGITRIQEGFKQGAQTVIVDGRVAGLTSEQANQILNRAVGTYQNKALPGQVEIWTNGGIIRR